MTDAVEGGQVAVAAQGFLLRLDLLGQFLLDDGIQLCVFDGKADDGGFDTDVAIATGELCRLLPDLYAALGDEVVPEIQSATFSPSE